MRNQLIFHFLLDVNFLKLEANDSACNNTCAKIVRTQNVFEKEIYIGEGGAMRTP